MKENITAFTLIAFAIIVGLTGYAFTQKIIPLAGAGEGTSYSGVSNTAVTCTGGASTSTILQGTSTARTSFVVSDFSSSTVTICKALTCTAGAGIVVTSTAPRYEQTDSYIGPYSCVGNVSSSVGLQTSP